MKKRMLIITLFLCVFGLKANAQQNNIKYFDENNIEISEKEFNKKRIEGNFIRIQGDLPNHKRLFQRFDGGDITDREKLVEMLKSSVKNQEGIDWEKTLVIIYYPGIDPCNASALSDKKDRKRWYRELEKGISKIVKTKPIYIYKEPTGLEKYDRILDWYPDPDGIVEKLFFEHHYPCQSFVIINEKGQYASYFGEFAKNNVWDFLKVLTRENVE
ncbi:MAG TPA: hypothetical protein VKY32_02995 [Flavobacterium sp.]|nr:hypothetical protein [Flavobacterium sp.]